MSTKADLKENILASKLEGTVSWLINNRSTALIGVGVLVGAILISSVFVLRKKEARALNVTRLSQAQSFLAQKQYEQANQILNDLATSGLDRNFSNQVSFHQGLSALGAGDYDKAISVFQTVVDTA